LLRARDDREHCAIRTASGARSQEENGKEKSRKKGRRKESKEESRKEGSEKGGNEKSSKKEGCEEKNRKKESHEKSRQEKKITSGDDDRPLEQMFPGAVFFSPFADMRDDEKGHRITCAFYLFSAFLPLCASGIINPPVLFKAVQPDTI
jgi:hypothetical protein